jgi:hypothetical protein
MNTENLITQLGLPGYALGVTLLLVVMIIHGAALLQIAKRYEVKSYLYLEDHQYTAVKWAFYISIVLMFLTHIFEIIFCGFVLWALHLLSGINESILFAGSTYTAMGFMDDILPIGWKMLAVTIAFSGMFTFAWTASAMVSMTKNFRQAFTKQHMHHLKLPAELIERFK